MPAALGFAATGGHAPVCAVGLPVAIGVVGDLVVTAVVPEQAASIPSKHHSTPAAIRFITPEENLTFRVLAGAHRHDVQRLLAEAVGVLVPRIGRPLLGEQVEVAHG